MIKKLTYIAGAMALVLTVGCGGGGEGDRRICSKTD